MAISEGGAGSLTAAAWQEIEDLSIDKPATRETRHGTAAPRIFTLGREDDQEGTTCEYFQCMRFAGMVDLSGDSAGDCGDVLDRSAVFCRDRSQRLFWMADPDWRLRAPDLCVVGARGGSSSLAVADRDRIRGRRGLYTGQDNSGSGGANTGAGSLHCSGGHLRTGAFLAGAETAWIAVVPGRRSGVAAAGGTDLLPLAVVLVLGSGYIGGRELAVQRIREADISDAPADGAQPGMIGL